MPKKKTAQAPHEKPAAKVKAEAPKKLLVKTKKAPVSAGRAKPTAVPKAPVPATAAKPHVTRKTTPHAPALLRPPRRTSPSATAAQRVPAIKTVRPKVSAPSKPAPVPEAAPPVKPVEIPKPPIAPAAAPAPTAPAAKPVQPPAYAPLKKIQIDERTTIRELSEKISKSPVELIKKLLSMGAIATITQRVDRDVASLILHEFGYEAEFVSMYKEETLEQPEEGAKLKPRAPIVTVMGHVDHGKTSLLDAIRKTHVTEQEFGGITQHIGAYKVKTPKGDIVFLDTPGHEAFTAMRAHGAKVTDLVILVVAADDGVMPQTVEAIDHARAAGVPIIVAINKIDLPKVNPQNVKQQLSQHGLLPEDWGGDVMMVEISARNNINIDKLLETVLFRAELLELKANPDRPGRGVVIEARLDPGKGPLATILLQTGTIKAGDAFVCGLTTGKVRALIDDKGKRLLSAVPSTPVEVLGFSGIPSIGDRFAVVKDERLAREMISKRRGIIEESRFRRRKMATLADLAGGKIKELNIIIKTDVHGSLNAVRDSLERFDLKEIRINTIHSGVGAINESDVNLAITSNALIIGFNVRPDPNAEAIAKRDGVDIRTYKIIYELLADIKKALEGMLEPKTVETVIGRAEIKKTFPVSKVGNIAGCLVTDGKATRSASVRLIRNASVVYEGKIASLKRFKEDVREVEKGYECGILLENYNDVKVDDVLEFYVQEKVAGELNASV